MSKSFQKGNEVEKNLVLNTTAHGFYMGARHCEARQNRGWKFWISKELLQEELVRESIKAANHYLKVKKFTTTNFGQQALIRATVSYGFREGYEFRSTKT